MQVVLPPELELIVSRQLTSGKYPDPIAVIRAAIWQSQRYANELLEQQDDIYQGRLGELQQAVRVGWEASQLYKEVVLNRDFPQYELKKGDIAMLNDYREIG